MAKERRMYTQARNRNVPAHTQQPGDHVDVTASLKSYRLYCHKAYSLGLMPSLSYCHV